MIEVRIPTSLRDYCKLYDPVRVSGLTVDAALHEICQTLPELYSCICDETGTVRKHIHVFVNSEWIPVHKPQGREAGLQLGDVLTIWTAVSGG